jgi:hypothetical protein
MLGSLKAMLAKRYGTVQALRWYEAVQETIYLPTASETASPRVWVFFFANVPGDVGRLDSWQRVC